MFKFLGRFISHHPVIVVLVWLVTVMIAVGAALTGFGTHGLFASLKSESPVVDGAESAHVYQTINGEGEGEAIVFLVDSVDESIQASGLDLTSDLDNIDGVDTVVSPFVLRDGMTQIDDAQARARAEVEAQLSEAQNAAYSELDHEFALAQQRIDQLFAVNPAQAQYAQDELDQQREQAKEAIDRELEAGRTQALHELESELAESTSQRAEAEQGLTEITSENAQIIAITLDAGLSDEESAKVYDEVTSRVDSWAQTENIEVYNHSTRAIGDAIVAQVQSDLVKGESIGLPVALILMVIVFGGLLAAGLPLIGALTTILCALGALWILTFFSDVDSFIINIISIIGLGLSIDYGLLVVSRYREEVARLRQERDLPRPGRDLSLRQERTYRQLVQDAVEITVQTAGRTVFFSALTIAFSIGGLLVMDAALLRTIAFGGIVTVLLAVFTAMTLVPALIQILSLKLLRPTVLEKVPGSSRFQRTFTDAGSDHGFFSKLAAFVHTRPWMVLIGIVALLCVLAVPVKDMSLRSSVSDYIPQGSQSRIAYDTIKEDFPNIAQGDVQVLVDAPTTEVESSDYYQNITDRYEARVTDKDGVSVIDIDMKAADRVGEDVVSYVNELRETNAPWQTWVGGDAALQEDFNHSLAEGTPAAITVIVISVFILLFLMTGSLMVPIKALLINGLSLIASLGATTWLFEGGHFGLDKVSGLESYVVAIALAFGFGLAMDYEVFLLARIKEYWDHRLSNDEAVERGLQRSGRIITSAAAIIVAVFVGFVFGDMAVIQQTGVALAIIVIVGATVVRMLLVPATMTLLGHWNWWAPRPLRRIHDKFGIQH